MTKLSSEIRSVSVVMCTYNGEKYIREQLDSILCQTYPIEKIYIQDDCSTDKTVEIIKEYAEKHSNLFYKINKAQLGVNQNFFEALRQVDTEYIAICDQDDIWSPDKIEKQIQAIGNNWLCCCLSKPFSSEGLLVGHFDERVPNHTVLKLIFYNVIPGHTMLLQKEILNYISEKSPVMYDWQLAYIASSFHKVYFVPEKLVDQRRHVSAVTYLKPLDTQRSVLHGIRLVGRAFKLFFQTRQNIKKFFSNSYCFLSTLNSSEKDFVEAQKLCQCLARQTFFSFWKASRLCIRNRDKIFYYKESNKIYSYSRAFLQPILMYLSFDKNRSL